MVAPVRFELTLKWFWVICLLPIGLRCQIFKANNSLFNKPVPCSIWFLWWWPISGVFYTGCLTSSSYTLEKKFGGYISANISSLLASPSAFSRTWDRLSIKIDKSHYELGGRGIIFLGELVLEFISYSFLNFMYILYIIFRKLSSFLFAIGPTGTTWTLDPFTPDEVFYQLNYCWIFDSEGL